MYSHIFIFFIFFMTYFSYWCINILFWTWPNHLKQFFLVFLSIRVTNIFKVFYSFWVLYFHVFPFIYLDILILTILILLICYFLTTQQTIEHSWSNSNFIKFYILLNKYSMITHNSWYASLLHPPYFYSMIHVLFDLSIFMND